MSPRTAPAASDGARRLAEEIEVVARTVPPSGEADDRVVGRTMFEAVRSAGATNRRVLSFTV